MNEILNSILRARQRFVAERGKPPKFVALDAASYQLLVHELRTCLGAHDVHKLERVANTDIVVVPAIPELLCVVDEPSEESTHHHVSTDERPLGISRAGVSRIEDVATHVATGARIRFISKHGKSPAFFVMDQVSYLYLQRRFLGSAIGWPGTGNLPVLIYGVRIIMIPKVRHLLCAVGEPWEEALRDQSSVFKTEYENRWEE